MMKKTVRYLLPGVVAVWGVAGSVDAQFGRRTNDRAIDPYGSSSADVARLRAMDVAGVRLGMAPDQAKAALRAAGYSPAPSMLYKERPDVKEGHDYATRVDSVRRERLRDFTFQKVGRVVTSETWRKGDEQVQVGYIPLRDGIQVSDVRYTVPEGRTSWPAMKASVIGRYGQPTRVSELNRQIRYCGDGACAPFGTGPHARLELTGAWQILLSDGGAAERLSTRQAAEDADRSIAKTAKPTF